MKLAEALSLRADLQKRIDQMGPVINSVCRVQEGDEPTQMPDELFAELDSLLGQWEQLVIKINRTNENTVLADGKTLTAKIAHRDMLKKHCKMIQALLDTLTQQPNRYSRQEIKYVNVVGVPEIRKKFDSYSKRLRETDSEIQAANWTVDLLE